MAFATSIQTFAGPHTGLGNTGNMQCTPDWARGFVYIHSVNSNPGANGGYVSQSSLLDGSELGYVSVASINDATNHVSVQPPSALASDGNLFISTQDGMCKLDTTAWTRGSTWGEYTSAAHPFGPPGPPDGIGSNDAVISGKMCATTTASHDFVYGGGFGSVVPAGHWTFLCNLPTYAGGFTWAGRTYAVCSGAAGSGNYWLICGNRDTSLGVFPLNLYLNNVTDGGSLTTTLLHSYAPADIDVAYTHVECTSIGFDGTDGNLLAFVVGQVGANNYLVKFNAATGAIIWQTLIPAANFPGGQMEYSNISRGKYCYVTSGSPNTIYTVNTNDGTYTTQTAGLAGVSSILAQCFDELSGAIIANLVYNPTAGGPAPLNGSTNHSGWAALYVTPRPPVATDDGWFNVSRPLMAA